MTFDKACYWVALGVLAFFLSNNFMTRNMSLMANLPRRSLAVAERLSDLAIRFVAMANLMADRSSSHFARSQATVACSQARLASIQAVLARHEAALAQVEAQRARVIAIEPLQRRVICRRHSLGPVPSL